MLRLGVVLLCSIPVSGAAFAFPKAALPDRPPIVRVQEEPGFSSVREPDCQAYLSYEMPAECTAYFRKLQEKRAAAAARLKEERAQKANPQQHAKAAAAQKPPARRSARAAKPFVPDAATLPVKPPPGKTPEERLRFMVGQLVLTGFSGREPEDAGVEEIAASLRAGRLSGVIVRDSNVTDPPQLRSLISAISAGAGEYPPIIAIEQPGGPDTVLAEDKGFTFYASANEVSGSTSPYDAQLAYRAMASELAGLGVTLNIGPSGDACREDGLNLSAICFGTSPAQIAAFARAFHFGHHDHGVLTALRHVPFRRGLSTQWLHERPSSAMVHALTGGGTSDALVVRVKAVQPPRLLDIAPRGKYKLTRSFGYNGVLIFEIAMGSGGAPLRYSDAVLRAFEAGADMVLVREPSGLPADVYAIGLEAVHNGLKTHRIALSRIEDAYQRVQRMKARLQTFPSRTRIAGLNRGAAPPSPGKER